MTKEEIRFRVFEYAVSAFKPNKMSDFEVVGALSAKLSYAIITGTRPDFSGFEGE